MNNELMVVRPLDIEGDLYVVLDDSGNTIGTGSREVCEALLKVTNKQKTMTMSADLRTGNSVRGNVRAAIKI